MKKISIVLHLVTVAILVLFSFMFYVMFDESVKIHDSCISVYNSNSAEMIPKTLVNKVITHENQVARLYVVSSDMFNVVVLTTAIFSLLLVIVIVRHVIVGGSDTEKLMGS